MPEHKETSAPDWEVECLNLRNQIRELKAQNQILIKEKSEIGMLYDYLSVEKCDLDGKIRFLEGQIEAYQYCLNCRR